MIRLKQVDIQDKELLRNINQKYLYEMTLYYPDVMDENGDYHYGYFDAYFTEPERKAYFINADEILIGFAMLNPYSYLGRAVDNVIAEFTIFPAYRGKHFACEAAELILETHPGKWEIKFSEKNIGAKRLWETVTRPYDPMVVHINNHETVLAFSNEQ